MSKKDSRGIFYWKNREIEILLSNIDKLPHELAQMLPGRTEKAIYQKLIYHTTRKGWKGAKYSIMNIKLARRTKIVSTTKVFDIDKETSKTSKSFPSQPRETVLNIGNVTITIKY